MTGHEPGGVDPLARIVFAVLILSCLAAFFITQRLKHTPTLLQEFKLAGHFSPYAAPGHNQEPISFKLAHAEAVTITIVDVASSKTVASLLSAYPVPRYKHFSLHWNGHLGAAHANGHVTTPGGRTILVPENRGAVAPPGEYRVEVTLLKQGHTVPSRNFTVEGPVSGG